ncbi:MAG: hypothetical protein AAF484_04045 [Pseudomonadota bacterium]
MRLDRLLADLQEADSDNAQRIARDIEHEWTKSGSPSADLLLKRGRDALEAGETEAAIDHLTALTDHAPEFAEGWHMRALAFASIERFGPAIADLEQALALEPRHFNAIASLAGILYQVGYPDMSREALEMVLELHPHHTQALDSLGAIDSDTGGADL